MDTVKQMDEYARKEIILEINKKLAMAQEDRRSGVRGYTVDEVCDSMTEQIEANRRKAQNE